MKARYLFQQDKHYDVSYDTGDKVRQCRDIVDIVNIVDIYTPAAEARALCTPHTRAESWGRCITPSAEGPPAHVLRGQRSRAAALSNTSLTLLPARLRHPSRSRSDSGYCQCQSREYQYRTPQYHAWLLMLQRCYNVCPFLVNKSIWAKLSLLLSSRNQTIRCQVRRLQARSSFSFTKMKSCEKALTVAS